MTIRKGEAWGHEVQRPQDLTVTDSDAALAALVAAKHSGPLGVSAGDVFRAVGSPEVRDPVYRLSFDALRVVADGVPHVAVAHVIARRSWWWGGIVAVMNVDHVGGWNVAPRAHPNDGRFDVVEVHPGMPLRQRWQARARLGAGTHVPHPNISTRTAAEASWHFDRAVPVWIDGVRIGRVRDLAIAVEADAFSIHI